MANEANFNYKNNPVLEAIEKRNFHVSLGICINGHNEGDEKIVKYAEQLWSANARKFGENIWQISKTFEEASELAKTKLDIDEMRQNVATQSGTILTSNMAICYNIKNENGIVGMKFMFFDRTPMFIAKMTLHTMGETENMYDSTKENCRTGFWTSNGGTENMQSNMNWTVFILNFIKYAELQTKILPPNSKIKKDAFHKYVNETGLKITMVNSTWFTTLVQSEGFKVRGHLRLQPYKNTKKFIWISEFEKTGYTAPARKLSHEL